MVCVGGGQEERCIFLMYQEDPRSHRILVGISRDISGLKIKCVIASKVTVEPTGAEKRTQNDGI